MNLFTAFPALARDLLSEWRVFTLRDLQFSHRSESFLALLAFLGLSIVLLTFRLAIGRSRGRNQVVVPAVLSSFPRPFIASLVHLPLVIFLTGLGFLFVALADPQAALVRHEATFPGRRICVTIDASNSMSSPFRREKLETRSNTDAAFFSTVAAAEQFVRRRMNGSYRDLIALVEFGSQAYVVTPFTNDYENILLSLSLIGDPREFALFPDQQTLIAGAIEQSVELFRTFEFLDASGNLMVIFSDGEDTNAAVHGRPLDDIIKSAVDARIPVYFVRTNYDKERGDARVPDKLWSEAVEQTGGKFFAASNEQTLMAAIDEIDRLSAGTIEMTEYSAQQPRFAIFAFFAVVCFISAITSKLAVPFFQRFP